MMLKYKPLLTAFLLLSTIAVSVAQKPKATILSPVNGAFYTGGQEIIFKGSGFDSKDGNLPASAFRWQIVMNHGKNLAQHWHDGIALYDDITEGKFNTPVSDDHVLGDSIYFRFYLYVTNSAGKSDTTYVDIVPKQSKIKISTQPAGINVNIQGYGTLETPLIASPTQNMLLIVTAIKKQVLNGQTYTFSKWSTGETSVTIAVTVPSNDVELIATYTLVNATEERLERSTFNIYPNPATDKIILENKSSPISSLNIQIFDIRGNLLFNQNENTTINKAVPINISQLAQGFYYLKLNTEKGYLYHPFCKE